MITKLSLHLLSNIKNLKALEYDHLYRISLLTIKIMHNQHIRTCMENFYDAFFRYRFESNNLTECLLEHIQNITDSSLIRIVCSWLDIVVHYQHVIRKGSVDLEYSYFDPRKIISECIIKQIYNLPNNLRLRGSFLFYLTFIPYPHINDDEKLASICRQHILSQMKDLNEWTSDTVHCVMGSICLIAKHYAKQFKDDIEYSQSLLRIVTHKKFHQSLVSTWTNDKTILIHTIIEYFYENIVNNEKMEVTLSSAIDQLQELYENVKRRSTKMKLCYLILVSTNEESKVSDTILLACFQYINNLYIITQNQDTKPREQYDFLPVLKKACRYDSIKDAVIRLNKINKLVNLIRHHSDVDQVALSCSDIELAKRIQTHLQIADHNILILNNCNDDMEKEKLILSCKFMIVCLTNDYHKFQSELILVYKNQVTTVPIVFEDEKTYCPKEPFLKFFLEKYSSSLIRANINELSDSLTYEIEAARRRHVQPLLLSINTSNNSNEMIADSGKCTDTAKDLYKACKDNEISKMKEYLQNIDIKILNERISNGSTPLHIAAYNGHNEIVRLLLKAGASRTIRNRPYKLTPYEEARTQSTKDLFRIKLDQDKSDRFISNDVYIEWMTTSRNPAQKRIYLREKLNQLKAYKNKDVDDVYKELVERMYAYIDTLSLTNNMKQIAQQYFVEMRETLDPVYIIKAYTSGTGFHKYYNEFIAQHAIDFFDPFSIDIHIDYSLVKCLMTATAIVMCSKRFYKYRYCGQTYRGMTITEKDLYKYVVRSKIMNKSFLSTSKSKEIAEVFSGCVQEQLPIQTTDIAAFCTYIIKNSETALDLEKISEFGEAESEVLILPFSIFEVKSVQRLSTNRVHIELEEVSDEFS
ncbi:unnamed protein product [Adineta steineri]|uniref:Uncharacterized protein n=1 Tax=Adineta steineri TaxID=433720 RepID=A0A813VMQ0_9BILA|nr:unnamed protein product [Adineta steineri]CAF3665364.1 unnamed protein product [Adineta steineri]